MPRRYVLPAFVLAALGLFVAAPSFAGAASDGVQLAALTGALMVIAYDAMRADEVVRALALRAAACAFLICLAAAIAVAIVGFDPAFVARYAWAVMIGAWLTAWALLRMRLA